MLRIACSSGIVPLDREPLLCVGSCGVFGEVESAEGRPLDIMGPKWRRSEESMGHA